MMLLYLGATTRSLLASSRTFLRIFGGMSLVAFAVAYYAYARWFISIWCFFAAWLSLVLLLHLAAQRGWSTAELRSRRRLSRIATPRVLP